MTKKLTAALTAMALTLPLLPTAHATYPLPATGDPTEVTVVAKQIKNGDTYDPYYVEISLEVNYDYEDYSAVGVVLQYDPDIITPAESWDGDDGAKASMSGNTSWATRRALPTLGSDKWTTHTALAYETTDAVGDKVGYLYLGAEYPGVEPMGTPDPSASPAASPAAASASPAAASPGTSPDPDIYVNPVVVARFVYTSPYDKDTNPTGMKPEDFANTWDTGIGGTTSWDTDWTQNKYLTIAPDDVAAESPAQFGFAYYGSDLSERAYMASFPPAITPVPTPDPSASPTATPAATAAASPLPTIGPYTPPPVGARIQEPERMVAQHIVIVRGEGKSAKATEGMTLNDVIAIVFFDWDNTVIGTVTGAVGQDMTAVVNNYVMNKLVHPDLSDNNVHYSTKTSTQLAQREFSYRGEYPYDAPGSNPLAYGSGVANTVTDGDLYPLTNKLEYTFAGKKLYPNAPFAGGWTLVTRQDNQYAAKNAEAVANSLPEPYPGEYVNVLPKSMDNAWTSLPAGKTLETTPLLDASGVVVDSTGNPISPAPTYSDGELFSYDFSNIQASDLDDGVLFVKAVYECGEGMNDVGGEAYTAFGPETIDVALDPGTGTIIYSVKFQYRRINTAGYGSTRLRRPGVQMEFNQLGSTGPTSLGVFPEMGDVLDIEFTPSNLVEDIDYILRETYGADVISGGARSLKSELGTFHIGGANGKSYHDIADSIMQLVYDHRNDTVPTSGTAWLSKNDLFDMKLSKDEYGTQYSTAKDRRSAQDCLITLINNAAAQGVNYTDLSWYQTQYACLNDGAYASNTTAKKFCEKYPDLIDVLNGA